MTQDTRTVVGNISVSLDGRVNGPGGDNDMGWVAKHAVSDEAFENLLDLMRTSTTVLLGRSNYQGFGSYWPAVADDEDADPRSREFSRWLNDVEKIVVSRTLTEATWSGSRVVADDPADVVAGLRERSGGDVWVMSSPVLIRRLVAAGQLDRLRLLLCPEISGGGRPLFDDGLTPSSWRLTSSTPTGSGALQLELAVDR
ncbi:MAG: dihydrofolate reductase family protein [Pseudonocardia sp.]